MLLTLRTWFAVSSVESYILASLSILLYIYTFWLMCKTVAGQIIYAMTLLSTAQGVCHLNMWAINEWDTNQCFHECNGLPLYTGSKTYRVCVNQVRAGLMSTLQSYMSVVEIPPSYQKYTNMAFHASYPDYWGPFELTHRIPIHTLAPQAHMVERHFNFNMTMVVGNWTEAGTVGERVLVYGSVKPFQPNCYGKAIVAWKQRIGLYADGTVEKCAVPWYHNWQLNVSFPELIDSCDLEAAAGDKVILVCDLENIDESVLENGYFDESYRDLSWRVNITRKSVKMGDVSMKHINIGECSETPNDGYVSTSVPYVSHHHQMHLNALLLNGTVMPVSGDVVTYVQNDTSDLYDAGHDSDEAVEVLNVRHFDLPMVYKDVWCRDTNEYKYDVATDGSLIINSTSNESIHAVHVLVKRDGTHQVYECVGGGCVIKQDPPYRITVRVGNNMSTDYVDYYVDRCIHITGNVIEKWNCQYWWAKWVLIGSVLVAVAIATAILTPVFTCCGKCLKLCRIRRSGKLRSVTVKDGEEGDESSAALMTAKLAYGVIHLRSLWAEHPLPTSVLLYNFSVQPVLGPNIISSLAADGRVWLVVEID